MNQNNIIILPSLQGKPRIQKYFLVICNKDTFGKIYKTIKLIYKKLRGALLEYNHYEIVVKDCAFEKNNKWTTQLMLCLCVRKLGNRKMNKQADIQT